jgi:hypothetical protein
MSTIRIAAGQGFWGDSLEAPVDQVKLGPIAYLMLDYLAEVTMSIMQKQRARNPEAGYARDFVPLIQRILPIASRAESRLLPTPEASIPRLRRSNRPNGSPARS